MAIALSLARRVLDPTFLELIVLPTEQCNFRCTYCYEDFKIGRMSPDTVLALKRLITARADNGADLLLSWFGGEPLLAQDIVLEVSGHAQDLFAELDRSYVSHITTNAYRLRPDLFRQLLSVGVRKFQITLDGPRDVHDRTRVRRDGGGSFDVIWANLMEISAYASKPNAIPFHVSLRVHYDGRSVDALEPLIEDLEEHFAKPEFFSFNLHELEELGGERDHELVPVNARQMDRVRSWAVRLKRLGLHALVPAEGAEEYICYASRANSLIVRADGRLSKCTVALRDSYNDVGRLLRDGTLEVQHDKLAPWLRGLGSGDRDELLCPNVAFPGLKPEPVPLALGRTRLNV